MVVAVLATLAVFAWLTAGLGRHEQPTAEQARLAGVGPHGMAAARVPAPDPSRVAPTSRDEDFGQRFGASSSVVVIDASGEWQVGGTADPRAWSTIKPLLAAALLSGTAGDGLSEDEVDWVTAALSWSDNDAAMMLFSDLADRNGGFDAGAAQAEQLLRRAGDTTTSVVADPDSMGDTEWPLAQQARFWSALSAGCVLDAGGTAALLDALGHVVEEQAWGLGRIGATAYKGGWEFNEDGTWLVRQVGLVPTGQGQAVVAMAFHGPEGDLEGVTPVLDDMAQWVSAQLAGPMAPPACG